MLLNSETAYPRAMCRRILTYGGINPMQTFLPYSSCEMSAKVLDYRRLGKQRVEAKQLLQAIYYPSQSRWWRHPACIMWRNNPKALALYWIVMCREWKQRGYQDNLLSEAERCFESIDEPLIWPVWLGDEHFHRAHRSNLLRKLPNHYSQFGWDEPPNLPYVWPGANYVPNSLNRA